MRSGRMSCYLRFGIAAVFTLSCVSCAVTEPAPPPEPDIVAETNNIDVAWEAYSRRNFEDAMQAFDEISSDPSVNHNQQRQALLGKALIYLSTSPDWRNLDQARHALQEASDLAGNGNYSAGVNFFGSAVEGHFNAETDNTELNAKVDELLRELEKTKSSLAQAEAQNQSLETELEKLNTALEKMKELTLGD